MGSRLRKAVVLAFVLGGWRLALCLPAHANTTAQALPPLATVVAAADAPHMRLARNDVTLPAQSAPATPRTPAAGSPAAPPAPAPLPDGGVILQPVAPQPSQRDLRPPGTVRIALLLPLRAPALAPAAAAVRAGFEAAWEREKPGVTIGVYETDGTPQQALARHAEAAAANDVVVGPLTRSEAGAIARAGDAPRPTVMLSHPDLPGAQGEREKALPRNLLAAGLSVEDDARQVARLIAADKMVGKVMVIAADVAWQRRAARAFTSQWRALGLTAVQADLALAEGFPTPDSMLAIRQRIAAEAPQALFIALDASLAAQLRLAIGHEVPMVGTSQLNPLSQADWAASPGVPDLDGIRLVDIPWQLQGDHPAVMSYPRMPAAVDQRRSADFERLYALGIDAYRIAREIALGSPSFALDGVTGKLQVHFVDGAAGFERIAQPAVYQDGRVVPQP